MLVTSLWYMYFRVFETTNSSNPDSRELTFRLKLVANKVYISVPFGL